MEDPSIRYRPQAIAYKTYKVYRNSTRKVTVKRNLTLAEARKDVAKDMEINFKSKTYMLVYTKYILTCDWCEGNINKCNCN